MTEKSKLPLPALAGMMLAASLAPLGSTMIAVALPSIGRDVHSSDAELTQWLVASYLVASIALQSPGGKIGDLIGHGRALLAGLAMVSAGSLLGLLVPHLYALASARVLMAAGGAATVPAAMAILRNTTSQELRARVFGIFGAGMAFAAATGPLVGGALTEQFGWKAIFAANLPVIALALLLVLPARAALSSKTAGPMPRFDWLGSVLLGAGLTLVVVALRVSGGGALYLALGGGILLALFPLWERRVASPVVDFALFRRGTFFSGGMIIALQNLAMYPLIFQLPVFFDKARGLGPRVMGGALLALTLAMMIASLIAGRLSEKLGARLQVLLGSLAALAGLWWVRDLSEVRGPLEIIPGLVLMGAGLGLTSAPSQAASMSAVSREQSGMAGGMISTMRYLGGVVGIAAMGALLLDPASPASHRAPVFVYAGALVASAVLALMLPGRQPALHQQR